MAEVSQAYAGGGYVAYRSGYQIMNYGSGKFRAEYRRGNIDCEKEITLVADGYRLDGPGLVKAGESAQYSVISSPAPGRTFACSAEGRGVTLDPETLVLTVAEGTPDGTEFTVTAVPSDGGEPAVLKGKVGSGVIAMEELEAIPFYEGFSIALPADQQKFRRGRLDTGEVYAATRDETGP